MSLLSKKKQKCQACNYDPTPLNPLQEAKDGKLVHKHHFKDVMSKYYGKQK